jgi:ParB family transcriptional regulator, chromosome partitioning protein
MMKGIIEEVDIKRIQNSSFAFGSRQIDTTELSNSIRQNGLLQPIIVRTIKDSFQVVAGNRRYHACKDLGWKKILCHIVEVNDKEAFELAMSENIQRKALTALEEAEAFKAYIQDFGWGGISELASKISKSPSYVSKRLSLLNLPVDVIDGIRNLSINLSVAEELITIQGEERQLVAKLMVEGEFSSRETRRLIKEMKYSNSSSKLISEKETCCLENDRIMNVTKNDQRSFDKSITALKIALIKMCSIIEGVEDNWIVYEILMQHKNMLNSQIDLLIKEKKKAVAGKVSRKPIHILPGHNDYGEYDPSS